MMEETRSKTPRLIGETVGELLDSALLDAALAPAKQVRFSHPDITYLTSRHELDPRFIGRMLRIFGEAVVLESLRRFETGWSEAMFVGVCRNVEKANAEEVQA